MHGTMITITPEAEYTTREFDRPPSIQVLHEAVGGYIEAVPYFDTWKGKRCVAFCNEQGKLYNLPFNPTATMLWKSLLKQQRLDLNDSLVGNVIILTGDDEWMAEL